MTLFEKFNENEIDDGAFTVVTLIYVSDACIAGFHLTGGQCEPCPIGTYKETSDNSNCLDCPLGKDTSGINSTACGK